MKDLDKAILKMYNEDNKSTYEIAEHLNTYPNKIRRTLQKHGVEIRTKSSAQKNALKTGKSTHPTQGKKRSLQEKVKISSAMSDYWDGMDEKEKNKRCEQSKRVWESMSKKQREDMRTKGTKAIQLAAKEGSKLEKFIQKRLTDLNYDVKIHQVIIPAEKLEIDLYIPSLKTIIEVDGPSHFLPIWGEDRLQKQINADLRKSGTLLSKGFVVIRIKTTGKDSLKRKEDIINVVHGHLQSIEKKFPARSKRFIEVE